MKSLNLLKVGIGMPLSLLFINSALADSNSDARIQNQKALNLREKAKANLRKGIKKTAKAFGVDDLAITGIDLFEAITDYTSDAEGNLMPNEKAIAKQIESIVSYCKERVSEDGLGYDYVFLFPCVQAFLA